MDQIRPTAARLLETHPALADMAVQGFTADKFDASCRTAILAQAAKSADANERALSTRDLDLKEVRVVGRDDGALSVTLTYVAERAGYKTTAEIPLTLTGPALEGARAAMEMVIARAPFGKNAVTAKGLWQDPALEAKIAGAFGNELTAANIVSVTMDNGATYIGRRISASHSPFSGHPGDGSTRKETGAIYVTTNDIAFLSGREKVHVLADESGTLVVRSSHTTVFS